MGSVVVAYGLSYSMACEIFLDQGWNLCPLIARQILNHWTPREALHLLYNPGQTCITPTAPPDCGGQGYSNLVCLCVCVFIKLTEQVSIK